MKKFFTILMALLLAAFALNSCQKESTPGGTDENTGEKPKFGIISLVENSAFTDMRDGIIAGLEANGFVDGQSAVIDYQSAGGDMGTLATIASSMSDGSYTAA